jgi:hypothetical protein
MRHQRRALRPGQVLLRAFVRFFARNFLKCPKWRASQSINNFLYWNAPNPTLKKYFTQSSNGVEHLEPYLRVKGKRLG